MNAVATNN